MSDGSSRIDAARAGPVADFYAERRWTSSPQLGLRDADLDDAGRDPRARSRSTRTTGTRTYDREHATGSGGRWSQIEPGVRGVPQPVRGQGQSRCTCSGVRSTSRSTRFSGRPAPPHPGGAPNCGPHVMHEAYSHEVSSAGYWPGPTARRLLLVRLPDPDGLRGRRPAGARGARYDDALGEFVLPYEAVRTAGDPDQLLLAFLQSTYDVAADLARWDRAALERSYPAQLMP